MLRDALGPWLARDAQSFAEMFAENGVMEFPYAQPDGVKRLDGRQALEGYLPKVAEMIEMDRMTEPTVHCTQQANVVILEFGAEGRGRKSRVEYNQSYISVITLQDGHIVRYLDYWNPLILRRVMEAEQAAAEGSSGEVRLS